MALSVWTVAELGAFYTEHRSELLAHANRVLKDSAKAEEITQDSLIKFMLAAPIPYYEAQSRLSREGDKTDISCAGVLLSSA